MRGIGEIFDALISRAPDLIPEAVYACERCRDRGYFGDPARRCLCYLDAPMEARLARAGVGRDLLEASWNTYNRAELFRQRTASFPQPDSCLTLMGPVGTGKSHLAVAILRDWLASGGSGVYIHASALIAECQGSYDRGEKPDAVLARLYKPGLRVLDEAWGDRPTGLADDVQSQLIRRCLRDHLPLIVTTNLSEDALRQTEPKVCSRITGAGAVAIDFTGLPDYRQRAAGVDL
jgi:hypothetical protein